MSGNLTTAQILDAFAHLDFLEGELALATTDDDREVIDRDINALLGELAEELVGKVDALAHVVDRAEAEAAMARKHEQRAATRRRRAVRVAERCKERIGWLVAEAVEQGIGQTSRSGTPFVDTGRVRCSVQRSAPSVLGPERVEDWPEEWTTTTTDRSKARALKALKALPEDQWPEGFALVRRPSVRIKA